VIEAKKKGGALITAELAASYNKPVFAVPGNLNQLYSEGCNKLIRHQKALIYTAIDDLLYHLNWDLKDQKSSHHKIQIDLSSIEKTIIETLENHEGILPIDELAWKSQLQVNDLASQLLTLEFKGLVKSLPGKKYKSLLQNG
jgi:DNA processing protein